MPSQAVDALWHEFILYTRHYQHFCQHAFGLFLHHTPAVVLGANRQNNLGLRRAWVYACKEENINPRKALRLPLLFAIDGKLNIGDGFRYSLDCKRVRANANANDRGSSPYCAGDFSDSSSDGYFGDSSDSGDSSFGGDSGSDGDNGDGVGCGCGCGCGGD